MNKKIEMKTKHIQLPMNKINTRKLKLGDKVLISGIIVTSRDMAHRWMMEEKSDIIRPYLKDGAIYHCGPIMVRDGEKWICRAAGPTTSIREERYQSNIIQEYGIRCVIGKGGMGKRTAQALRTFSAVYLSAVGGAAVIYANSVQSVKAVYQLDAFGVPEAMWVLQVKDFPAIVTMDANGNSLHEDIEKKSIQNANQNQ